MVYGKKQQQLTRDFCPVTGTGDDSSRSKESNWMVKFYSENLMDVREVETWRMG